MKHRFIPSQRFFSLSIIVILFITHHTGYGQNINFNQSSLNFKNFSQISNGTSLIFGPDERLYVAQINGEIKIYTITQAGPNQYEVIDQETILGIKQIPNHDDNGQPAFDNRSNRQITGITVSGSASHPIIYVGSSDPKWGGPSGDKVLDTNSGIITKLTWTGTSWDMVDLVRGLPRSEENHSINGLEFTIIKGKPYLLLASGGLTNAGAPSKNFAYITEYALSAAIISIDLEAIEAMETISDAATGRKYKYDLPTLDDPSRPNLNHVYDPNHPAYDGIDVGDPFGGNDGLNMAMLIANGPVKVFSPGYRNAYDLVITQSKKVYVTDNGANGGWGGLPEFEGDPLNVNNNYLPSEPGGSAGHPSASGEYVDNKDQLLMITDNIEDYTFGSFYGGHPTPIRANPGVSYPGLLSFPYNPGGAGLYTKFIGDDDNYKNIVPIFNPTDKFRTEIYQPIPPGAPGFDFYASNSLPANWPPVSPSLSNGIESDFIGPTTINPNGPQPEIVTILPVNSNGIDEYKASNFGGSIKGSLIIGQSSGELHLINLNPNGSLKNAEFAKWNLNGGNALGISCNGDDQIFPGTIWVSTFDNRIMVLTPGDMLLCIDAHDPLFDPLDDYDFDGYTNQDEIDNGTDYCSGASIPNDYDKDFVSDLNDLDDDGDGIIDESDPFQIGEPRNLPINNELFSNQLDNLGRQSGYLGLGLTGLMNNGFPNPNWLNWLDKPTQRPGDRDIYGGAAGAIQVTMVGGTANGPSNNQEKGFQFGVNVGIETGKFNISSGMIGLNSNGQIYNFDGNGEIGIQMGDGTQSNFIKLVVAKDHIMAAQELNDVPDSDPLIKTLSIHERPGAEQLVELIFEVDPLESTVEAFYKFGNNPKVSLGTIKSEGKITQAIKDMETPLAVGIIGTTNDATKTFYGVWDYFRVTGDQPYVIRKLQNLEKATNAPDQIIDLSEYFGDNDGVENLIFQVKNNTSTKLGASIIGSILTLTFPDASTLADLTISATDAHGYTVEQTITVKVVPDQEIVLRINAGGASITDQIGNPDWLPNNTNGLISNSFYSVNTGTSFSPDFSATSRHSSIPSYISEQMFGQIFGTERYSNSSSMQFNIPLANGNYLINLYVGNGYEGTSNPGQRIFNVAVEGITRISKLDLSAKYGHKTGAVEQIPITLTDGMLNINFLNDVENPLINGIEIVKLPQTVIHNPIIFTPITDQISYPGDELDGSLTVEASGGDGNLKFSAVGLPPGILIEPTNGVIYGKVSENALMSDPYYVTITIDDMDGTTTDEVSFNFNWTISPPLSNQLWKIKNESNAYTGRHENSFVQAGNKFYLMGGRENAKTIDIYDYENDSWKSLNNNSPFDFNHFQAVEYQGLIWVIGAFKNNNFPNEAPADHVWAFDPTTEAWIQGPAIPEGRKRGSAGLVIYNEKFYLVNGNTIGHNGGYVNYFDEYDPKNGQWTILENTPRARDHFFATVINNELYVVSGRLSGGTGGTFGPVIPQVDVYNFSTKTWKTLPFESNLPTPRAGAIVNNYLNKIIVAGGEVPDSSLAHKTTEVYDPTLGKWFLSNPMNFARHGTQGIVSGKGLYVLSGSPYQGGGNQKNMEVFGFDEPYGAPLIQSDLLSADSLALISDDIANLSLNVKNGNTGIYIKSILIGGQNAPDFIIEKGLNKDFLLNANVNYELEIRYTGINDSASAFLEIKYGHSGIKVIPLKVKIGASQLPPNLNIPIPDQTVSIGGTYSFTFNINTFSDPDGDLLTYTATMDNGGPLPSWLSFNPNTRTLSGIPSEDNLGNIIIQITANDGKGGTASDQFNLTVIQSPPANQPPVLSNPIPDQNATVGTSINFTFAENTFSDPDGDALTYSAILSNGTALPLWLSFNANTRTFSGVPGPSDAGTLNIQVNASDGNGGSVTDNFLLHITNSTPVPAVAVRINSGGNQFITDSGLIFTADQAFNGGQAYAISNIANISNTVNDELYRSERYGNFGYSIPITPGTYSVRLHFAEIYFPSIGDIGKRIFNIVAEGQTIFSAFDILKETAPMAALVKEFDVNVTDGVLNLDFINIENFAKVSALEIISKTVINNAPDFSNPFANPKTAANDLQIIDNSKQNVTIDSISTNTAPLWNGMDKTLNVYPNPFENYITISINAEEKHEYRIKIYDLLGKVHFTSTFSSNPSNAETFTINLTDHAFKPGGLYLVLVEDSAGSYHKTFKMIKK
ncbi:malectin domain-containing carbohydrate-binding protein [Anditalea andensis]|uniref:Dystroglycan-type cadherin-like domain-containing protein n=1 Tax=Anditalea andensis TaxID=1048983 RepID=A0A074KTQ0_9BACT|nr:malectin domain-containing carbohydrate-binding protein [Anditalea andensis]KEO72289.1 hypothetical protein EL17_16185 [Anditalea andensis]